MFDFMKKITSEGLPILTEQTKQEVLNLSIGNPLIEISWRDRFRDYNNELYTHLVIPIKKIYYRFSERVDAEFTLSYEMLRRQSELIRLSPELPRVSIKAIESVIEKIVKDECAREKHLREIKSENPVYLLWTMNVLLTYRQFNFPEEFTKDCSDYLLLMYQTLKKQAQLNSVSIS